MNRRGGVLGNSWVPVLEYVVLRLRTMEGEHIEAEGSSGY